ncbi:AI-2E family transporter, partial [Loktanella sp. DJP18]|uniref:AI-2E family transporter n=1 Tax=Loktanella sp. DJP18 TaxID=3409788 RepID=UPI003BB6CDF4
AIIAAGIFAIEQIIGNYVDPRVQGRQVSLSPLVVLITLLVWSWVWGVAGAILAVPITIATMIVCAFVPPLRPFALLLSNASDYDSLDRQTGVSQD